MKKAILVISFGTSYIDTLEKTIAAVEEKLAAEFGTEVFRAFTSNIIIKKLYERDKIKIDTVETALEKLLQNGYTDIFCIPTHIMNGAEYDKACAMINEFKDKMNIRVSRPLISILEDYSDIVNIFKKRLTDNNRFYIFMGHGSGHFASSLYSALDYRFKNSGMSHVYIGTVEGYPDLDTVIRQITASDIRKVTLLPLMLVCGDHARNDMARGWKEELIKNGFSVECDLTGLGEISEIQHLYIKHLKDIWE